MSSRNCCGRNWTSFPSLLNGLQSPSKVSKLSSCRSPPYSMCSAISEEFSVPQKRILPPTLVPSPHPLASRWNTLPQPNASSSASDLTPSFPWTFSSIMSLHFMPPGPAVTAQLHLWTPVQCLPLSPNGELCQEGTVFVLFPGYPCALHYAQNQLNSHECFQNE